MAVPRAFKPLTVTTAAQPLIGTTLTTAITGNGLTAQTVTVADSSIFNNSDTVLMYPAAGGTPTELAVQIQVVDSTHVKGIFTKAHAAGEWLVLSWPCSNIQIQGIGTAPITASVFIGTTKKVPTTAGVNAFYDLSLSLYYTGPPGQVNSDNTANYWIISASGTQTYLPSAIQAG